MIHFKATGDYRNTRDFLLLLKSNSFYSKLDDLAQEGVEALKKATPKDTGLTSESWTYDITKTRHSVTITWSNTNFNNGVPIAMVIQYGHATKYGGYVAGVDYINPAMRPIFDKIEKYVMREVNAS